jgi:hypothetical protein
MRTAGPREEGLGEDFPGKNARAVLRMALATLIPATAGLLSGNLRVLAVAAIASTLLLVAARLASGVPLRWYAMPWIFYMLVYANWAYERRILASGDGGSAGPSKAI